jgi:hypothetical protein
MSQIKCVGSEVLAENSPTTPPMKPQDHQRRRRRRDNDRRHAQAMVCFA